MADVEQVTNRCACGWDVTGPEGEVVAATIDHGRRIHNMVATSEQVIAALRASASTDATASEAKAG